jgi:hypothetical protein
MEATVRMCRSCCSQPRCPFAHARTEQGAHNGTHLMRRCLLAPVHVCVLSRSAFLYHGFLSPEECEHIKDVARPRMERSMVRHTPHTRAQHWHHGAPSLSSYGAGC